jgi:hypothetical protein
MMRMGNQGVTTRIYSIIGSAHITSTRTSACTIGFRWLRAEHVDLYHATYARERTRLNVTPTKNFGPL